MGKTILFLFLSGILSLSLFPASIQGVVVDTSGRPVAGALVRCAPGTAETRTAADGTFILPADGQVVLTVSAAEYHSEERRLESPGKRVRIVLIPLKILRETVTVTALNEAEKSLSVPFAEDVVSAADAAEEQAETVVAALQKTPGVHYIGKGGVGVTPSLRGLARRRVLVLFDGARLTSDRSAGTAGSFIHPDMLERIEVLKSPASVLYGSDAMGGVLQVFRRREASFPLRFTLHGASADRRSEGSFALDRTFGHLGVQLFLGWAHGGDYKTARERVPLSGYDYYTGDLSVNYRSAARDLSVSYLLSRGRDIGKPERVANPDVRSYYPEEDNNLVQLKWTERRLIPRADLNIELFANPNQYNLRKEKLSTRKTDISLNEAVDFGLKGYVVRKIGASLSLQAGVDWFARRDVRMENQVEKNGRFDSSTLPVGDGRRDDVSAYFTVDYSGLRAVDLLAGVRYGFFRRSAVSDGRFMEKKSQAPAFFMGVSRRFGSLTVYANASRSYRMPSLSEVFYTGITGRTAMVANPELKSESGFGLDAGVKWSRRNLFLGLYLFQNELRDLIEKYRLPDDRYTYRNLFKGRLRGVEVEFQYYPVAPLELFGNFFYIHGKDRDSGQALNDVPPARLFVGARFTQRRFWGQVDWTWSAEKKKFGPAETALDSFHVCDVKAGWYLNAHLAFNVRVGNLFDRFYYPNADPDVPAAKGRDFSVGLSCRL